MESLQKIEKTEGKSGGINSEASELSRKINELIVQKEKIWKAIEKIEIYLAQKQNREKSYIISDLIKDAETIIDNYKRAQDDTEKQLKDLLERLKKIDPEAAKEIELLNFVSDRKIN